MFKSNIRIWREKSEICQITLKLIFYLTGWDLICLPAQQDVLAVPITNFINTLPFDREFYEKSEINTFQVQ